MQTEKPDTQIYIGITNEYAKFDVENSTKPSEKPSTEGTSLLKTKVESFFSRYALGTEKPQNDYMWTIILIINTMIGSGILNQPEVFQKSGILASVFLYIILGYMNWLGLTVLVDSGQKLGIFDYSDLTAHVFGYRGKFLVDLFIALESFGALLSYMIVVGGESSVLIREWTEDESLMTSSYSLSILFSVFVILPLCLTKHFGHLAGLSLISIFATIMAVLLVLIRGPIESHAHADVPIRVFSIIGSITKLGSIAFALESTRSSFLIYNSLHPRTISEWRRVTKLSMLGGMILCFTTGLIGYISFRDETSGNILNSFEWPGAQVFKGIFVIHLILYIPLDVVILRYNFLRLIGTHVANLNPIQYILCTCCLVFFSLGIVLLLWSTDLSQGAVFGIVLDFTGSLTAGFIAFVAPAAIYLRTMNKSDTYWYQSAVLLVLGVLVMTTAPIIAITRDY